MARDLLEFLLTGSRGVISDWGLPGEMATKLDVKLHMLRRAEVDDYGRVTMPSGALAGPGLWGNAKIYKLIVNGRQALRPMLCRGPLNPDGEWTVLARATERDRDTTEQKAAAALAVTRRQGILDKKEKTRIYLRATDEPAK